MNAHHPVLLPEVIANLALKPDGIYIDATFGRGGHARAILQQLGEQGKLFAFDKDPAAIAAAKQEAVFHDPRFSLIQGSFTELDKLIQQQQLQGKVAGILFDLGVSSPQLEDPQRGFSFLKEGPLDMRMNPQAGISAAEWLSTAKEAEITQVLREYGEERFARRIAVAIVRERQLQAITSTTQLAEIVAKANPKWEPHKNPATRSFQAIRIFINRGVSRIGSGIGASISSIGRERSIISY